MQWFQFNFYHFQIYCALWLKCIICNKVLKYNNIKIFSFFSFFGLDEVNRGGSRPFHRQLLQSVQRSAHLRVTESGTLRGETRFLSTSCLLVHRNVSNCSFVCLMLVILDAFIQSVLIIGTLPLERPEVKCLGQGHNDSSNNNNSKYISQIVSMPSGNILWLFLGACPVICVVKNSSLDVLQGISLRSLNGELYGHSSTEL